jgi:ABC-type polysaccharide/polyol phosphate export permease
MFLSRPILFGRLLWQNNYMIRSMVARDLRARYMGSLMGVFWSVIHPLTQIALYYFIFSVVLKIRLGAEYAGTSFGMWMIAGLLPWLFVAEVVTRSPSAVVEQANLVKKMPFPSELFSIVNLSAAMVNHLVTMTLFIGFMAVSGHGVSLHLLGIIPYLLVTSVFGLGIAWLLSSVNVFLRDVGQITGVVVNIWYFLTPIVYPRTMIPDSLQKVFALNPMLHITEGYRTALLGTSDMDLVGYGYVSVIALGVIALGATVFRRLKPVFADVL